MICLIKYRLQKIFYLKVCLKKSQKPML
ncbi:UNVERIFIED_CONTAM: hypothetical protein GTU68_032899 [Idotea baltica]|nr:hypothetical protein [Idotea baltica]